MEIGVGDRLFAVEDMTIEIKCPISAGVPKPKVFWRHNNAVIISNGVYAQVKDNNDLLIPKLDASLQGLYTCVAENIEGKDEASTTIMIMRKCILPCRWGFRIHPPYPCVLSLEATKRVGVSMGIWP